MMNDERVYSSDDSFTRGKQIVSDDDSLSHGTEDTVHFFIYHYFLFIIDELLVLLLL